MKCKELRAVTKHKGATSPAAMAEATAHIEACPHCRNLLLLDKLAPAIITAASASRQGTTLNCCNTALVNKIRSRIQEVREQRSGSWELAMESMRGWLAAFAVAAVVLIAVSIQWRPPVVMSDFDHDGDEVITLSPAEYLISDIPDQVGLTPVGKDTQYAHK